MNFVQGNMQILLRLILKQNYLFPHLLLSLNSFNSLFVDIFFLLQELRTYYFNMKICEKFGKFVNFSEVTTLQFSNILVKEEFKPDIKFINQLELQGPMGPLLY